MLILIPCSPSAGIQGVLTSHRCWISMSCSWSFALVRFWSFATKHANSGFQYHHLKVLNRLSVTRIPFILDDLHLVRQQLPSESSSLAALVVTKLQPAVIATECPVNVLAQFTNQIRPLVAKPSQTKTCPRFF